jgi:hypothetical protein
MRRLHLNGLQRIGIVLSVIWAIVGGLWGFYAVDHTADTKGGTVPPEGEEQRPDHQIIISYAGPEAQDRFDRRSLTAEDVRWDQEKVLNLASRLGADDETRDARRRQARELVKQHWTSIKRVAQALLKRGTLQSFEIDALLA